LAHRSEESGFSSSGDAWMTPDASDWKQDGLEASKRRLEKYSTISLNAQARQVELNYAVLIAYRNWPTPTVCGNNNQAGSSPKAGNGLATEVKLWPTPAAQDGKNATLPPSQISRDTLPGAILRDGQPDPDSPSTNGKSRALLNPRWVAQLQGFPSDWLDGIEWPL
jgi:site-specific DNA-cytosine methylase